jgi:hypothetical protein
MAPLAFPLAAFIAYTVVANSRTLAWCGVGLAVAFAAAELYLERRQP